MYVLATNMWFQKLMKQFFFGIDQVVYNMISTIYDLLISIARTSVLTQADILDMADRIYKLLAIFMVFKVIISLITYIVNPDDFSDKTKGVSKLATNIVISLALLILTPYIFNYAYRLQTIILEDNSLATLIFGEKEGVTANQSFINSAGDDMAYITMSAFFTPNTAINEFQNCVELVINDTDGKTKFNPACSGLKEDYEKMDQTEADRLGIDISTTMAGVADNSSKSTLTLQDLQNYVVGVENKNLGLMFRQEMAIATANGNLDFVMDYKYIFSTVVGVIVILLLITFCMDVAVRSIKLAFLQLIAPVPILSYIDPKSGKDGMFKKWYQLCFKTFLSLFVRLLALYFAIYIISRVADMKLVDIIDGSYQTNAWIYIFVIIGALMFAKDFPKILEGLGIKLDGDGKFFLNPIKKMEESAMLGKNVTGLARGAMVGTAGALSGAGLGRGISGAWKGMTSGKGWSETGKAENEMNKKMRQARLDGSTFAGRMGEKISAATGFRSRSESLTLQDKDLETRIQREEGLHSSIDGVKSSISSAIEGQKLGNYSKTYNNLRAKAEAARAAKESLKREDFANETLYMAELEKKSKELIDAENAVQKYLKKEAVQEVYDAYRSGKMSDSELTPEIRQAFRKLDSEAAANGVQANIGTYADTSKLDEATTDRISELQNDRVAIREAKRRAAADESVAK